MTNGVDVTRFAHDNHFLWRLTEFNPTQQIGLFRTFYNFYRTPLKGFHGKILENSQVSGSRFHRGSWLLMGILPDNAPVASLGRSIFFFIFSDSSQSTKVTKPVIWGFKEFFHLSQSYLVELWIFWMIFHRYSTTLNWSTNKPTKLVHFIRIYQQYIWVNWLSALFKYPNIWITNWSIIYNPCYIYI